MTCTTDQVRKYSDHRRSSMRDKTRRWVRLLVGVFALLTLLLGTAGLRVTPAAAAENATTAQAQVVQNQGDAVPDHTTVPAGTIAVWEIINNVAPQSIKVWSGVLPSPLTTSGAGDIYQIHAWAPYPNVDAANAAGCQQAQARWAHRGAGDWFPNYPEWLNDVPFNGTCNAGTPAPSTPPSTPPIAQPVPPALPGGNCDPGAAIPGTWEPAGSAVINREFGWDTPEVWIWTSNATTAPLWVGSAWDGNPLHERAIWHRPCDHKPWDWMQDDACREAAKNLAGSLGFIPRSVHLNGVPFYGNTNCGGTMPQPPTVCSVNSLPVGTVLPAGSAAIVRGIGADGAVWLYNVSATQAPITVTGDFGFAVWSSCDHRPWASQDIDTCGEAVEVIRGGLAPFQWTTVWIQWRRDGPVDRMPIVSPYVCPDP